MNTQEKNIIQPKDIHIPKPCSENWNAMDGSEQKKFCDLCNKHVVQITGMTKAEYANLKEQNPNGLCVMIKDNSPKKKSIKKKSITSFLFQPMSFVLGLLMFFISSCKAEKPNDTATMGEPVAIETNQNTQHTHQHTMGKPVPSDTNKENHSEENSEGESRIKMGDIAEPQEIPEEIESPTESPKEEEKQN